MEVWPGHQTGKTYRTVEELRCAINKADPGQLKIVTFPANLETEVKEMLADRWANSGYHYAMSPVKKGLVVLSFIPGEDNEDIAQSP